MLGSRRVARRFVEASPAGAFVGLSDSWGDQKNGFLKDGILNMSPSSASPGTGDALASFRSSTQEKVS